MQKEMHGVAWALGLWGAFSVVFGALIMSWPGITLKVFLIILGIYFVISGLALFVGSLINLNRTGRWVTGALLGGLSVVAGLYVFANPQLSALVAIYVVAIWGVAVGILQIAAGLEGKNNWWMVIAGVIYTLFGLYIFGHPLTGALALTWVIGLSTVAGGIALIITAFELNNDVKKLASK